MGNDNKNKMDNKEQIKDLVSVIAVCYNHEKFLVETLDSIKNQTYKNIELIIMDDCSSDNSVQKIQEWIKENKYNCTFVPHKQNQGVCKTLNEAISYCHGEYIQMVSCDDVLLSYKIQLQVNLFKELDNKYGVVYSDAKFIDENSKEMNIKFIAYHTKGRSGMELTGNIFSELAKGNFIPAMSVLMKRKMVEQIGQYDEALDYEDYDYWLRISKEFYFYYINEILVKYRMHSSNLHKKITTDIWRRSDILIGIKHIKNSLFLERVQKQIIDLYYTSNDRNIIDKFYAKVAIKKLQNKATHFAIRNNFPSLLVKIAYRVDALIKLLK